MNCYSCSREVLSLLDMGAHPVAHRFKKNAEEKEEKWPLELGQCSTCGLIQLVKTFPAEKLLPIYDWITYIAPDENLDQMTEQVASFLPKNGRVIGLSYKDQPLLDRLGTRGYTARCLTQEELGTASPGVEAIQGALTKDVVRKIAAELSDLVVARHILEHAYDPKEFLNNLASIVGENGYIVLEVPDCRPAFLLGDVTTVWEEHLLYFTEITFKDFLQRAGFVLCAFEIAPYPLENSLIAILKRGKSVSEGNRTVASELSLGAGFAVAVEKKRKVAQQYFAKSKGRIALLGAGHLACMYLNYFNIAQYFDFVVDDEKNKQGLFLPGTSLEVKDASALQQEISLCLLGVNPRIEESVQQKHADFSGTFASIFPASPMAVHLGMQMQEENPEVFYLEGGLKAINGEHLRFLKAEAEKTGRARFCLHPNTEAATHEMIIAHAKNVYVRPHRHRNKAESLYMIEGEMTVVFFDEAGNIDERLELGTQGSGKPFYYRIDGPRYHMMCITSEIAIFHEVTAGPFRREDTEFPSWAPAEDEKGILRKRVMGADK